MEQEKIEKVCFETKDKLETLGIEKQLVAEIDWCLGSFANDHNPVGLFEKAGIALKALKKVKKSNPRKVSKKLIDELEKLINLN